MTSLSTRFAFITLCLAACGGGGEPRAPAVLTDLPLDTKLSALDYDERYFLCKDLSAYYDTQRDASLERMCAAEAGEGDYVECDERYEACLNDPPREVGAKHYPSTSWASPNGCGIPNCDATVRDVLDCYEATVTVAMAVLDVFSCEGVSDEEKAQIDDIAEREDERCDAIRAKCPGAIE